MNYESLAPKVIEIKRMLTSDKALGLGSSNRFLSKAENRTLTVSAVRWAVSPT